MARKIKDFKENRVMFADSYKYGQPPQYPDGTVYMFDYMEARGGEYPETLFFGLQYMMQRYFSKRIKMWEVKEARDYAKLHGIAFDYKGWKKIVKKYKGRLPVKIKAVKEGSLIPTGNVLMTIESTDSDLFWVPGWLETFLMKIWYPTTVSSKSHIVFKMIKNFMRATSDNPDPSYMYHNFGDRGSTCVEAAAIGGMAHTIPFKGTDNFNSLRYVDYFYTDDNVACSGHSINASEHSTVTSWGQDLKSELKMYSNHLETFKSDVLLACVLDSTDIFRAVDNVTSGEFKEKIESSEYPIFIQRPDSGDPLVVIKSMLEIMEKNKVAYGVNTKTLKVFNKYRIIWGDGITKETILDILNLAKEMGYAPDNFAFGSGGDLMQNVNRDTSKFAIKCAAVGVLTDATKDIFEIRDVFKDPITDPGKKSKKGQLELIKRNGTIMTVRREELISGDIRLLEDVWYDGHLIRFMGYGEVRDTYNKCLN